MLVQPRFRVHKPKPQTFAPRNQLVGHAGIVAAVILQARIDAANGSTSAQRWLAEQIDTLPLPASRRPLP